MRFNLTLTPQFEPLRGFLIINVIFIAFCH
nr:MAG TPA: hypothetical protein [Caudoviricetes sp.]